MRSQLPINLLVLEEAEDFLEHTRETDGPNRGPAVNWILKAAELDPGLPWCAAFVNRIAEIACAKKNIPSPLELVPLEGYVQSYYDTAVDRGWLRERSSKGRPGDLFVIWHAVKGRFAHIGFVAEPQATEQRFGTIEGNSNDEGSREGYEVCSNLRPYSTGIRFIDPWEPGE